MRLLNSATAKILEAAGMQDSFLFASSSFAAGR